MDGPDGIAPLLESTMLSYDDTVAYEEQLPTEEEQAARTASLVNRIGNSRVYLLSESAAVTTRTTKRKHENEEDAQEVEDDDDEADTAAGTMYRNNAILFNGEPISHLPTARLFAYATHFDAYPMGLEWVDDQTCVFVFATNKEARDAFTKLSKPAAMGANPAAESNLDDVAPMTVDDPADPDFTSARSFPLALWPPEERINQSLGQGYGFKGPIRMRWARAEDVKKKGAKHASQFYKKHGSKAGKESFEGRALPRGDQPSKRKRQEFLVDEDRWRRELDKELDDFLAEDETVPDVEERDHRRRKRIRFRSRSPTPSQTPSSSERAPSPVSKMRSDYIANDGRTLLERTSVLRFHPEASDPLGGNGADPVRSSIPLPRRQRGGRRRRNGDLVKDADSISLEDRIQFGGDGGRDKTRRGPRRERKQRGERTLKTHQELDDELDAFLNGQD